MILKKCSICGKDRLKQFEKGELLWQSDIIIVVRKKKNRITVCPECRELPFVEILTKTIFGEEDQFNI